MLLLLLQVLMVLVVLHGCQLLLQLLDLRWFVCKRRDVKGSVGGSLVKHVTKDLH